MFSVIFPGQGSQTVGMCKEIYDKYPFIKEYFEMADEALNFKLSKMILEGPKNELDLTINTQPAIFLASYSIFNLVKNQFNINLSNAKYFAGHSLGEYSALSCAGYLDFTDTIKILRLRGEAMQNSVPLGVGGMLAILGSSIDEIEKILNENQNEFKGEIANDNSEGQLVISGKLDDLKKLMGLLKTKKIKNIQLPVSAPFHCSLMSPATEVMKNHINNLNFKEGKNKIISNVTSEPVSDPEKIKSLLIGQIESRVRWRETVINMINDKVDNFIEIGPGKVLAGLVKRINKNVKTISINSEEDIKNINL